MDKDKLSKWTKKVDEIQPCIWTVTMIHKLGSKVEKTGENLEEIEREVENSALEMDKQIEEKIRNTAHNTEAMSYGGFEVIEYCSAFYYIYHGRTVRSFLSRHSS